MESPFQEIDQRTPAESATSPSRSVGRSPRVVATWPDPDTSSRSAMDWIDSRGVRRASGSSQERPIPPFFTSSETR
jgi:hypothetical protein